MSKFIIVYCIALVASVTHAATVTINRPTALEDSKARCINSIVAMFKALLEMVEDTAADKENKSAERVQADLELLEHVKKNGTAALDDINETVSEMESMDEVEEHQHPELDDYTLFCDPIITQEVFFIVDQLLYSTTDSSFLPAGDLSLVEIQ